MKADLNKAIARRFNELGIPRMFLYIPPTPTFWKDFEHGAILIVKDFPDGTITVKLVRYDPGINPGR